MVPNFTASPRNKYEMNTKSMSQRQLIPDTPNERPQLST